MRGSHKLALLEQIAAEMHSRYEWTDIIRYLNHYDLRTGDINEWTDQLAYVKDHLQSAEPRVLVEIAEDLELQLPARRDGLVPPKNWPSSSVFRVFISHIAKDKQNATRLRDCLAALESYNISSFVAHQDIQPTLEWQGEMERALNVMDAFVAIHTPGFSQSFWTQQEIGFAVARGVKLISLHMGEDPTGFISKHQALPRLARKAEDIAQELCSIFRTDPLTKDRFLETYSAPALDPDGIPF